MSKSISVDYPISVDKMSLNHKGGTKSYHFVQISSAAGKVTLIFRWGKTGQFGDIQVKHFDTKKAADAEFEKKFRSKSSGGYRHESDNSSVAEDEGALRKILGRAMLPNLSPEDILHVDPNFDTAGMKNRPPPRLDEDGKLNQETLRAQRDKERADVAKMRADSLEKEKAEADQHYAENPIYGAF